MHIHKKDDKRIFVFGSNLKGIHGAGAAKYAVEIGAQFGKGVGLYGNTYAIPTCKSPGVPLEYDYVHYHVENFLSFAKENQDLTFFISEIGTGFAGFSHETMAVMFYKAPANCDFSDRWKKIIEDHKNKVDEIYRIATANAVASYMAPRSLVNSVDDYIDDDLDECSTADYCEANSTVTADVHKEPKYIMSIPMNIRDESRCRCGSDLNDESNHRCHSRNYGCANIGAKRITSQYKFTEVEPNVYKYIKVENSSYTTWACDNCWKTFQQLVNASTDYDIIIQ